MGQPGLAGGTLMTGNGILDEEAYNRARQAQAMQGLWAGLLSASGPSLSPRGMGSSFGAGLLGQMQAGNQFDESQYNQARTALARAGIPKTKAEIDKLEREGKLLDATAGLIPQLLNGFGAEGAPTNALPATGTGSRGGEYTGSGDPASLVKHYESNGGDYNVGYGGADLSNAPRDQYGFPQWSGKPGPDGRISHAAGAYQFQPGTWARYAKPLGIKDFSPESQDKVFAAAFAAEGWAPWAPYNPRLRAEIARRAAPGSGERTTQLASAIPDFTEGRAAQLGGGTGIVPLSNETVPAPMPPAAAPMRPQAQGAPLAPTAVMPQQMTPAPQMAPQMQPRAPQIQGAPPGYGLSPQQLQQARAAQAYSLGMSALGRTAPSFIGEMAGLPMAGAKVTAEEAARAPFRQQQTQFEQQAQQQREIAVAREKAALDANQQSINNAAQDGRTLVDVTINGQQYRLPLDQARGILAVQAQQLAGVVGGAAPGAGAAPAPSAAPVFGTPSNLGNAPEGQRYAYGPNGQLTLENIPGGPRARAEQEQRQQGAVNAGVVTQDIGRAIDLARGGWVTGAGGLLGAMSPLPSARGDFNNLVGGIGANLGLDRLQELRKQSPTGAGLGSVTEGEHKLLRESFGSLDPGQSEKQLSENLHRVYTRYMDAVNGSPAQLLDAKNAGKITEGQYEAAMRAREYRPQPAATAPLPPTVNSKSAYDKLPSGSTYVAPDGSRRVKP